MNELGVPLTRRRVAIVGFGSIGRRHFENLARLGVHDRVVIRRPRDVNPAITPPPDAKIVTSIEEAISEGIDAAILCHPTVFHPETALNCLTRGVSTLIEKPLARALADAERDFPKGDQAWPAGAKAAMAYCLRYHPAYRRALRELRVGSIGRPLYAKAWFEGYLPDWHPWEDYRQSYAARRDLGGGALPTLDHEIDFLHGCLGKAKSARGWSANSGSLDLEVDDLAQFTIEYSNQVTASVTLSLCRRDPSRGFEFIGERGTLRFDWRAAKLESIVPGSGGGRSTPMSMTLWDGAEYDLNRMYLDCLADFLGGRGAESFEGAASQADPETSPVGTEFGFAGLDAGLETLRVASWVPSLGSLRR